MPNDYINFGAVHEIIAIASFQEVLGTIDGGRILDVACGAGQSIELLVNSLGSWDRITGLDLSDKIMEEAKQKFRGDHFSFVTGTAQGLPFEPDSFDMVCLSKGLHHVPDPVAALNEMLRVVNQDGYLLVIEMYSDGLNAAQESQKMYHHLRVEVDNLLGVDHNNTFRKTELLEIMMGTSLREVKVFEYSEPNLDPHNPEVINEYVEKMGAWIEELQDHPESSSIKMKLKRVEGKMIADGFSKPPLLIFLGKK